VTVDGNDVLAVYEAAAEAVARARAGKGPTLIETKTYRWRKHTERKHQLDRRPPEEIEAWKAKDPIRRFVEQIRSQQGQLTEAEWEEMDRAILERIEAAVAYAKASPFPAPEKALEDVFAA
jgi:pyruvate dehydrogenase E1 component alpha subunit